MFDFYECDGRRQVDPERAVAIVLDGRMSGTVIVSERPGLFDDDGDEA
jgi:hypothetical protein